MEIQVNIEELKKKRLFVATPMYGGMNHGLYMKSCLDLQATMGKYGVETKFSFLFNESLITRARNYLVDEFLRTDYTHLLFIDSDIHFNPQDVVALLALDKDVIGGPYPKKSINWPNVAAAARNHPNLDSKELEKESLKLLSSRGSSKEIGLDYQVGKDLRVNLQAGKSDSRRAYWRISVADEIFLEIDFDSKRITKKGASGEITEEFDSDNPIMNMLENYRESDSDVNWELIFRLYSEAILATGGDR